jgi:hypothetical protein
MPSMGLPVLVRAAVAYTLGLFRVKQGPEEADIHSSVPLKTNECEP